jgi:lysophospholipase L1-like esterase|nr:MAG TPA: tailspike protein [Caudoviricetes sp.]
MTTYNTGNPVPSGDARDRFDNTETLDEVVSGSNLTAVTRIGKTIKTLAGQQQDFNNFLINSGFEPNHLNYIVGTPLTVSRPTQLIDYLGSVYRVKMPQTFPLTLSGTWAADLPLLTDVGDMSLRQDLAAATGSTRVGTPRGTVESDILALRADDVTQAAQITSAREFADTGVFGQNMMLSRVRARTFAGAPFMHVFGDSISHGAFADDWYRNGWVNLFKRMLNLEMGTTSYGVTPILPFVNPVSGASNADVHDVVIYGGWTLQDTLTDVPTGASWIASVSGVVISITVPTFQYQAAIYYAAKPGGGSFDILINDILLTTVNTSAETRDAFRSYAFLLNDNGYGKCTIKIRNAENAPVEITGIGYFNQGNQSVLQNFSESGRLLRNTSEALVRRMMGESALFVMALGVNDYYDHLTDDTKYNQFVQVISWLIQYANQFEVPVVVPDFVWYAGPSNRTRVQLKRLATETKGTYIPFPDYFMKNSIVPNAAYLTGTLNLFTNDLHPNVAGHKYIAEVVAKKIGLSVTSKKEILDYHDWWYPLELNPAAAVTNKSITAKLVSATKNQGGQILVRLNLTGLAGAVSKGIALGYPSRAAVAFDIPVTTQLTPTSAGVSQGVCIFNDAGISILTNAQNAATDHQIYFAVPRTF